MCVASGVSITRTISSSTRDGSTSISRRPPPNVAPCTRRAPGPSDRARAGDRASAAAAGSTAAFCVCSLLIGGPISALPRAHRLRCRPRVLDDPVEGDERGVDDPAHGVLFHLADSYRTTLTGTGPEVKVQFDEQKQGQFRCPRRVRPRRPGLAAAADRNLYPATRSARLAAAALPGTGDWSWPVGHTRNFYMAGRCDPADRRSMARPSVRKGAVLTPAIQRLRQGLPRVASAGRSGP